MWSDALEGRLVRRRERRPAPNAAGHAGVPRGLSLVSNWP